MKNIIKKIFVIVCLWMLTVTLDANESIIKVSLNNGVGWVTYKSINEFTNNFHLKSTIKSTTVILQDKNLIFKFPSIREAFNNIKIVNSISKQDTVIRKNQNSNIIKNIDISIYPNPFNDLVNIHFDEGGEYKVVLFDIYHNQTLDKSFYVQSNETVAISIDFVSLEQSIWEIIIYKNNQLLLTKNLVLNKYFISDG